LLGVLLFAAANAQAQVAVRVGVGIGAEPVCAYGYYPYYPNACAPYGYWAPNYFVNGVFIGVGPWYHAHWRPAYWGPHYYGRGYYGPRPGWGYRPGYGYYRPVYGGPVHGYARGEFHGGGHR
jgi:hypothetical protein